MSGCPTRSYIHASSCCHFVPQSLPSVFASSTRTHARSLRFCARFFASFQAVVRFPFLFLPFTPDLFRLSLLMIKILALELCPRGENLYGSRYQCFKSCMNCQRRRYQEEEPINIEKQRIARSYVPKNTKSLNHKPVLPKSPKRCAWSVGWVVILR